MSKLYITNAFSLSMLNRTAQRGGPIGYIQEGFNEENWQARIPRPVDSPKEFLKAFLECNQFSPDEHKMEIVSAIGHADVAAIISNFLEIDLPVNRVSIKLDDPKDIVLIGQYIGPRLPEGTTKLPDNAKLEWWFV